MPDLMRRPPDQQVRGISRVSPPSLKKPYLGPLKNLGPWSLKKYQTKKSLSQNHSRNTYTINSIMTPPRAFDFAGEVALVTGAGSRMAGEIGNGRATAILLARQGARVALVDFNEEWALETKRMIDEEGGVSEVIQADVTDEESCRNAVEQTVKLFGGLHILVNIGKCFLELVGGGETLLNMFPGVCSWCWRCHG